MSEELLLAAEQESSEGNDLFDEQMKEIIKEYELFLNFPKNKPRNKFLLCPVGLIGSGKTTVVKKISQSLGFLRISTDEIREVLKKYGFNMVRTAEITLTLIKKYLDDGYSVSIDADCISPSVREQIIKISNEYDTRLIWIHINTSEENIVSRMEKEKLSKFFDSSSVAIREYKRRKPLHEKYLKEIDFYYIFNSVDVDIEEQVKKFVIKFKKDY